MASQAQTGQVLVASGAGAHTASKGRRVSAPWTDQHARVQAASMHDDGVDEGAQGSAGMPLLQQRGRLETGPPLAGVLAATCQQQLPVSSTGRLQASSVASHAAAR